MPLNNIDTLHTEKYFSHPLVIEKLTSLPTKRIMNHVVTEKMSQKNLFKNHTFVEILLKSDSNLD